MPLFFSADEKVTSKIKKMKSCCLNDIKNYLITKFKNLFSQGSLVHVAPAWPLVSGLGNGLTTLGLMYAIFPYICARGCFQDLTHDLMVTRLFP
jgi:hypothetical protein